MNNHEIATILNDMADSLEMNADNPYRIKAYRRAAGRIETWPDNVVQLVNLGADLTSIPTVGKGIAAQIKEIVRTGKRPTLIKSKKIPTYYYQELKHVAGLGTKRIKVLRAHHIHHTKSLLEAIQSGYLRQIPGFNEKLTNKLLHSIQNPKPYQKFYKIKLALMIMTALREHLLQVEYVTEVVCASDYRRRVEIISQVDLLVMLAKPCNLIDDFIHFNEVQTIMKVQPQSVTVLLHSGMQVTLHIISPAFFGAALLYYTGSSSHFQQLQKLARQKKSKLDEYGLLRGKDCIAAKTEAEIYSALGLNYIEPELRENRGEIAASKNHQLPKLIQVTDIRGDLHSHTTETDGTETLAVMVQAALVRGYEYIAITDHSQHLAITNGLNEKRLRQQIALIDELNSKIKGITILKSIEVDILENGSLDLSNDILQELDLRVCSIHSKFKLPEKEQTERILRAMDNPYFNILGHATGRLINYRPPYLIDMERIIEGAKIRGCFLELNAQPSRLDIKDDYCLLAKKMGVKLAISTDAHSIREFDFMKFGIFQARRGWIEPDDVINTRNLIELKKLLKR